MRLKVLGGAEAPQVADQLVLSRGDISVSRITSGILLINRRDRGIPRLDEDQLGLDQLADDTLDDAALADIGFDCENERHHAAFQSTPRIAIGDLRRPAIWGI